MWAADWHFEADSSCTHHVWGSGRQAHVRCKVLPHLYACKTRVVCRALTRTCAWACVRFDLASSCPHLSLSETRDSCHTVSQTVLAPAAAAPERSNLLRRVAKARRAQRRLAPSTTRRCATWKRVSRSESDKTSVEPCVCAFMSVWHWLCPVGPVPCRPVLRWQMAIQFWRNLAWLRRTWCTSTSSRRPLPIVGYRRTLWSWLLTTCAPKPGPWARRIRPCRPRSWASWPLPKNSPRISRRLWGLGMLQQQGGCPLRMWRWTRTHVARSPTL